MGSTRMICLVTVEHPAGGFAPYPRRKPLTGSDVQVNDPLTARRGRRRDVPAELQHLLHAKAAIWRKAEAASLSSDSRARYLVERAYGVLRPSPTDMSMKVRNASRC
jgi:hypothetical protein